MHRGALKLQERTTQSQLAPGHENAPAPTVVMRTRPATCGMAGRPPTRTLTTRMQSIARVLTHHRKPHSAGSTHRKPHNAGSTGDCLPPTLITAPRALLLLLLNAYVVARDRPVTRCWGRALAHNEQPSPPDRASATNGEEARHATAARRPGWPPGGSRARGTAGRPPGNR